MFYIFTVVVDKVDNDLKNNDYNRVVQDIKEYNSKPNSEDANNQTVNKQSEINETKPVSNKGEVKNVLEKVQEENPNKNIMNNVSDTDIVVAKNDSPVAIQLNNSETLKQFIKANYNNIQKGLYINKSKDIEFPNTSLGEFDKKTLYWTFHNANAYKLKVDADGYVTGYVIDYYDFARSTSNGATAVVNNNAYYQQEHGTLGNYVLIVPFRIKEK